MDPSSPPVAAAPAPRRRVLRERVSYNAVLRFGGRTSGAVITVYALHLALHFFSKTVWGEVVAATALANLFVGVCDFGVGRIASRDLAADQENRAVTYGAAIWAGLAASVVAMAVMVPACLLIYWDHPAYRSLALDLVLSLPPNALWLVSASVLVARSRNDVRAVIDVLSSFFLLGVTALVIAAHFTATHFVWLTVGADVLTAVLGLVLARVYLRADLRHSTRLARKTLRSATPIGTSLLLYSLYLQGDVVLLALVAPPRALAAFGVAYLVVTFGTTVPPMLTAAMLPKFVAGDLGARQRLTQRVFDVLVLGGAGVTLLGIIFAGGVLTRIGGAHYDTATVPLAILSGFAGLFFPLSVFLDGLVYVNGEKDVLRVLACVTAGNLVAAAVCIPLFGPNGAAAVMTASVGVQMVASGVLFSRRSGIVLSLWRAARFVGAAAAVLAGCVVLQAATGVTSSHTWLMVPQAGAVGLAYLAVVLAVGGRALFDQRGRPNSGSAPPAVAAEAAETAAGAG